MHPLFFLLTAICLGILGQLLMKYGTTRSGQLSLTMASARIAVTNPFIVGGVLAYAVSSVFYIVAVSRLPMSYAYPLIAISYVAVTIAMWQLFREDIPPLRWAGLAVICLGVILLALSHRAGAQLPAGGSGTPPAASGAAPPPGDR